jgi:glycerophosphoryl diester phosphodiesterase
MHDLLDMGVDGLMTDDCALLKKVLVTRNLW